MNSNYDVTTNLYGRNQIIEGTTVYDAAGEKVGSVQQLDPQGGYLLVQTGQIFHRDVYVPLDAIARTDADGVYLNLYKDALGDDRYANPPAMRPEAREELATMSSPATDTVVPADTAPRDTRDTRDLAARDTTATDTMARDTAAAGSDDITVPVLEEQLVAEKQRGETGHAHLHKDVVQEQQALNVPLTHEEVRVERAPVEGRVTDVGPAAFQERDIEIPLMGERVITEKEARVVEEVRLHKQPVTEQRQVTDTVRKERVRVEGAEEQTLPLDQTLDRSADQSRA